MLDTTPKTPGNFRITLLARIPRTPRVGLALNASDYTFVCICLSDLCGGKSAGGVARGDNRGHDVIYGGVSRGDVVARSGPFCVLDT